MPARAAGRQPLGLLAQPRKTGKVQSVWLQASAEWVWLRSWAIPFLPPPPRPRRPETQKRLKSESGRRRRMQQQPPCSSWRTPCRRRDGPSAVRSLIEGHSVTTTACCHVCPTRVTIAAGDVCVYECSCRTALNADEFVPASAVEQCRLELKQMETHYTPGESCFRQCATMYVWCDAPGGGGLLQHTVCGGPARGGSGVAHLFPPSPSSHHSPLPLPKQARYGSARRRTRGPRLP